MLAKRLQSLFLAVVVFALLLLPAQALADDGEGADLTSVGVTQQNIGQVHDLAASLASLNAQRFATRTGQFTWDTEGKTRSWTYYNGIMMDAYLMLDSETYLSQVNSFYRENISGNAGTLGQVDSTGASGNKYATNELDSIPPTRAMFDLLKSDSQEVAQYKDKYRATIDYVYSLLLTHKKADGAGGNFMHKTQNTNWSTYQVALDGLYMAQPFFMEVANLLDANDGTLSQGDFNLYTPKVQNFVLPDSATLYHDVYERMKWIGQNLYVEEAKLYSHGWGPLVPDDHLNHQYWLRAVGWYAAALADVISMMPTDTEEHVGYREDLIDIEEQLFEGMLGYQDPKTGMWYNVIDAEPGLQGSSVTNELESSGSALMAYAMMRSYSEGLVDATYGKAGLRAFNGTVSNMLYEDVVKNVPQLALHNVYKSSGVATTQEGYLTSTYEMNEAKGVGPLMMAAAYADAAAQRYAQEQPPAPAAPEFKSQTLLLSGQIGVNFYVDLSMLSDEKREATTMEFTVGGKTTTDTFDSGCTNPSTHEYYGFTCYINSVQMSDPITATLHYGDGQTVTETYSADWYVQAVVNNGSYSSNTVALVKAIADYGHYAQPFLAANNGWNLVTDHKVTAGYNEYTAEDVDAVRAAVANKAFSSSLGDSQVEKITYSLNFETETAIRIYLKMKEGYTGIPTATVGGQSVDCVEQKDRRYRIEIAGISAHKLGDTYHVVIDAGGEASCDVSAFSYVRSALNSTSKEFNNDEAHFAVTALYKYYEAAINYKNNPTG